MIDLISFARVAYFTVGLFLCKTTMSRADWRTLRAVSHSSTRFFESNGISLQDLTRRISIQHDLSLVCAFDIFRHSESRVKVLHFLFQGFLSRPSFVDGERIR